jgi:hypothetical protein
LDFKVMRSVYVPAATHISPPPAVEAALIPACTVFLAAAQLEPSLVSRPLGLTRNIPAPKQLEQKLANKTKRLNRTKSLLIFHFLHIYTHAGCLVELIAL